MKKTQSNTILMAKQKENLPLHKLNDMDRRKFITSVGSFMAAFGVPSMIRLESMEKLSKKVFGSSTAFAQGSGVRKFVTFRWRQGMPFRSMHPFINDQVGQTNANRALHFSTGFSSVTNPVNGNMPAINFSPQSAPYLTSHAGKIAMFDAISSASNHTPLSPEVGRSNYGFLSYWAAVQASGGGTLIPNPIAFVDENRVNIKMQLAANVSSSQKAAQYGAQYLPTNYGSFAPLYNQFKQFDIKAKDGSTLSAGLKSNLINALGNFFNDEIQNKLKYSKYPELAKASQEQAATALAASYGDLLNPDSSLNASRLALIRTGNAQNNKPNSRFDTIVDYDKFMVVALNAMEVGITNWFEFMIDTGDWHSRKQKISDGLGNGANSDQGRVALYFSQILGNALTNIGSGKEWDIDPVFVSVDDHQRGALIGADFPDKGSNSVYVIDSQTPSKFVPGIYGNVPTSGNLMAWNVNTGGNTMSNLYPSTSALAAYAYILGINISDVGISDTSGTLKGTRGFLI
ncbi:MAG: hypothetical protein R3A11_04950 [Bdellovibrionota bacterium]